MKNHHVFVVDAFPASCTGIKSILYMYLPEEQKRMKILELSSTYYNIYIYKHSDEVYS